MTKLTPKQIAFSQLEIALSFYMRGENLVAAITLAGAAEEILGKLAHLQGKTPSLFRRAENKRALFRHLWPNQPDPGIKPFIALSNDNRNAMKHLITTKPLSVDLEIESGRLLARAVENYVHLFGAETALMRSFQRKRLKAFHLHGGA